jgi:membrane-bound lytic murein transglycosylase MltF
MLVAGANAGAQAPAAKGRTALTLDSITTKWTGDFDGMTERRMVRVLTVYSKTLYFVDKGTPRGTAYDQGKLLEAALNPAASGHLKINIQFVPMSRDELIPALLDGRGDIIMADMTVTPERQKSVTFTEPWIAGVSEIVVTGPAGPAITSTDDLSGQEIFVRESSSYYQSLLQLNERFKQEGKPPAILVPAPEELEDEDLLEMANANLVNVLIVDTKAAEDRFRSLVAMFRKYGSRYNLDWMLMAAQGYQESRLDQNAKSHVGAIGVMQVMPATGKELAVGDIRQIDPNIHAGVKYIRFMIDRYFATEPMTELDKGLFAFAAYNAGPGRVRSLRREATTRGLDPNVWFNNVERIAAERIGRETVTYVSNIYKYYVAYLLVQGEYLQRRDLKTKKSTAEAFTR